MYIRRAPGFITGSESIGTECKSTQRSRGNICILDELLVLSQGARAATQRVEVLYGSKNHLCIPDELLEHPKVVGKAVQWAEPLYR